ncbi:MAG TPA: asparagine synthase (glutamine-hydrolyzing), partial [Alphaproteobacteria bacterium]|nr:asparagine synthase (glutamine-hydrolyzing) [Alphaproteobacteria bacterium]
MCGIVGYLRFQHDWQDGQYQDLIMHMSGCLAHRGPDSDGHWIDSKLGLAFGHRRLSIIDLSPAGHQPMISSDGQGVLILNGEIYNFAELRSELELIGATAQWRGHSDTEVLLTALRHFGIEKTLQKINGMYAFAYADLQEKKLYLARDRFGEKPLYIYRDADGMAFSSELKAFKKLPHFDSTIDSGSVAEFMAYAYVPQPRSIYQRAKKLPPGCYAILDLLHPADGMKTVTYWSARDTAINCRKERITDESQALSQLDDILRRAVKSRMAADVPLGAFLSGGIDSSTVVALMQAQSSRPIKTYAIGFAEDAFNEAPHAKAVAEHLGTQHTEQIVTAAEAMAVIPYLPEFYDEPFADSSQIPTYLV